MASHRVCFVPTNCGASQISQLMVHDSNYAQFRVLKLSLEEAHGPCSAAAAELERKIGGLKQELALACEQRKASQAAEEKSREQVICLEFFIVYILGVPKANKAPGR